MLTPEQIRRRAINRYEDFLRSLCTGESLFPLALFGSGLKSPKDFGDDRAAIESLRKSSKEQLTYGYAIAWEQRNSRRMGMQNVPAKVTFPTQDDYVQFLGKAAEVAQFEKDRDLIRQRCPELVSWLGAKPLKVIEHAGDWDGLLSVSLHLKENPRPNCYLRELPVVVDTKFVERRIGILSELLPIVAPLTVGTDSRRFETQVRLSLQAAATPVAASRPAPYQALNLPGNDFATPLDQFQDLPLAGTTVLIVENEMTFLSLPWLPKTVALFGAGDGAALLSTAGWLASCRLFYWGDLDCHGFETLAHLRKTFSSITSVLMDSHTFEEYSAFVVGTPKSQAKEHLELTFDEHVLYVRLAESGMLLEQERIPFLFSKRRLLDAISK